MDAEKNRLAAERFQMAMSLYELGENMLRQKLRRAGASEAEVEAGVQEWLHRRPGAELGDAEGTPVAWPRRRE